MIEIQKGDSPFYTPFDHLIIKSDESDPYSIFIEASNENPDSEKDIVFVKALQDEAESFLNEGVISWDHLHKIQKSPEFIIGEPEEVKFKDGRTFIKGRLYKHVEYAQSVVKLLKSRCSRLGASIGGFIRGRKQLSKTLQGVVRVIWDEVALTYKPINKSTLGNVSLMPIGAFVKALMVGSEANALSSKGGGALTKESLDHTIAELVWRMKEGDVRTEDDLKSFLDYQNVPQLYGHLSQALIKKFRRN